jgi:hypothetical protein
LLTRAPIANTRSRIGASLGYRSRTGQRPMKLEGSRESLRRGEGPSEVAEIRPFAAEAASKFDVSCLRPDRRSDRGNDGSDEE